MQKSNPMRAIPTHSVLTPLGMRCTGELHLPTRHLSYTRGVRKSARATLPQIRENTRPRAKNIDINFDFAPALFLRRRSKFEFLNSFALFFIYGIVNMPVFVVNLS